MNKQTREEIVQGYKAKVASGEILVGVGAGTGITAKSSEAGGRIAHYLQPRALPDGGDGAPWRAYSPMGCHSDVCEMASEVLPVVKNTPVLSWGLRQRPSGLWKFS